MKNTAHRKVKGAPEGLPVFPAGLLTAGQPCLVVGGGKVALRKIQHLLDAAASVTVVSPAACPEVRALADQGRITLVARAFEDSDIPSAFLAFAATADADVNRHVLAVCRRHRVLCCAVDSLWPESSFVTPAIFRKDDVTVAVSTGGRSCRQARVIKDALARHVATVETADIVVLGVSHESLTVEERERFHLAGARLEETGRLLRQVWGLHEFLLLNTCNRAELIAVVAQQSETAEVLRRIMGFDHPHAGAVYLHAGYAAYEHVALLTAGLLSQTPGENHIVSQVKEALGTATRAGWAGSMLEEWIASALHVSRHIRERTAPLLQPLEIEDLCFQYLSAECPGLAAKRVLVLGTGVVGTGIVARCLRMGLACTWCYHAHRPQRPTLSGPDPELCTFAELAARLGGADVVICAAASAQPVLHSGHARCFDGSKPVFLVDLALPRNVAPDLKDAGAFLRVADLDDLKHWHRRKTSGVAEVLDLGRRAAQEHRVMYDKIIHSFQGWHPRQSAGAAAGA